MFIIVSYSLYTVMVLLSLIDGGICIDVFFFDRKPEALRSKLFVYNHKDVTESLRYCYE